MKWGVVAVPRQSHKIYCDLAPRFQLVNGAPVFYDTKEEADEQCSNDPCNKGFTYHVLAADDQSELDPTA